MRPRLSVAEKRANAAERQRRHRARVRAGAAYADHIMSTDPDAPHVEPPAELSNKDLATMLRDRLARLIETMSDEELLNKDVQAAINNGLKAQAALDKRAFVRAKQTTGELAFAIIALVQGANPAPALTEGDIIDGIAVEVPPVGEAD